jgi:hypothetical protein
MQVLKHPAHTLSFLYSRILCLFSRSACLRLSHLRAAHAFRFHSGELDRQDRAANRRRKSVPISKPRVTSFGVCSICKIRKKVANTHTHNNTGREGETVTFMHTFTHVRVEAPIYLMTMQTFANMLLVSERSSSLVLVHLLYTVQVRVPLNSLLCVNVQKFCVRCELVLT